MKFLVPLAVLLFPVGAWAQTYDRATGSQIVTTTPSATTVPIAASVTRPPNATPYTGGQALCASTSVDCVPLQFQATGTGTGLIHGVTLIKSGTGNTNAQFTVQLYSAAPTLTGIHDGSTYSPAWADRAIYRGYATCSAPVVNGDNAQYACQLSNPNGTLVLATNASKISYAVIQVNAAYTPASGEVFQVTETILPD